MGEYKGIAIVQKQFEESQRMMFEKDRLETFNKDWKELKGYKYCSPKNFAAAGFYNSSSQEFSDNVKCFACLKELSDWEKNDDPWNEHVKRGSRCPYVLFRTKETTTVRDFFQLQYEIKKNVLNHYFEWQKNVLKDKEKELLKSINSFKKSRK